MIMYYYYLYGDTFFDILFICMWEWSDKPIWECDTLAVEQILHILCAHAPHIFYLNMLCVFSCFGFCTAIIFVLCEFSFRSQSTCFVRLTRFFFQKKLINIRNSFNSSSFGMCDGDVLRKFMGFYLNETNKKRKSKRNPSSQRWYILNQNSAIQHK